MKIGASTFIWVSPFSNDTFHLFSKVKKMGFDILEICVENPQTIDPVLIRQASLAEGVEVLICGAFGMDRDISADDEATRLNGINYIKCCIDIAAEVGSPLVSGPMYSATGKTRLLDPIAKKKQISLAVANMRIVADYADQVGISLAVEPLNRYETDFINTVDQGLDFFDQIGKDNVGFLIDTFHMNIEEKSIGEAIRRADKKVFNFHACANDRGTPGVDHLNWIEIKCALEQIGYDRYMVIESFTTEITEIARAVSQWRPLASSADMLASEGIKFLKKTFI